MVFNSLAFLGFLVPVLILYYGLPGRFRALWVFLASLAFYAFYNWKVVPFLVIYALAVYALARGIAKKRESAGKGFLAAGVILLLAPLVICKYSGFAMSVVGADLKRSIVLPLGISYFTFKSVSYLIDVWRGKAEAENDPVTTAAFVTFFPEILTGPIDRAGNLMRQLKGERPALTADDFRRAALLFLAGCAQKMVIADRIGLFVDAVYGSLEASRGVLVVIAALGYSLQIYFDFAGCTLMALGVGRLMGFKLPENFRRPYLGTSVADFWRRWHISLTSWLRDYLYIPLGGNRKGTARKYLNILIVFLVSGIWHGAGWTFIIWGLLNGIFQVIESLAAKGFAKLPGKDGTAYMTADRAADETKGSPVLIWLKRAGVFILMTLAWVFFRAPSLNGAAEIFRNMGTAFPAEAFKETMAGTGLKTPDIVLIAAALVICLIIAVKNENGWDPVSWILARPFYVRCLIAYGLIFSVILFGIYGTAYDAASFIYLQF